MAGQNSIAGIIVFEGDPNPNPIMYMFASISGMQETVFAMLCGVVLWRYRNLIPLMLAMMLLHLVFLSIASTLHPLTPDYFTHTPPAMIVKVPKYIVLSGLLAYSLWTTIRSTPAATIQTVGAREDWKTILFPPVAGQDFSRGRVLWVGFGLLLAQMTFRATVHLFKADSGVNSFASIIRFEGDPDPNTIIYLFSALGGAQQMVFVIIFALVAWRYRSLIPLMLAVALVDCVLSFGVVALHPMSPDFYAQTPPGMMALWPRLIFVAALFVASLRKPAKPPGLV